MAKTLVVLFLVSNVCYAADKPLTAAQTRLFIKACRAETAAYVQRQQAGLPRARATFAQNQSSNLRKSIARRENELKEFAQGRLIGPILVRPLKVGQFGCVARLEGRDVVTIRGRKRAPDGDELTLEIIDGQKFNNTIALTVVLKYENAASLVDTVDDLPLFVRVVQLGRLGKGAEDDVPAVVEPFDVAPIEKALGNKNWLVTRPAN